jgi:membrane protease YdiL (CAAX protease family)
MALWVAEMLAYRPPGHPLVEIFLTEEQRAPWLIYYSIFLAVCVGPVVEEIVFRGFCYPIFKKRFGVPAGMIMSAGLFAWIHENSFAFWPIFVLGLVLAYLYEKRKSLIAPITLHVVHNGIFLAYFFLAKNFLMKQAGF